MNKSDRLKYLLGKFWDDTSTQKEKKELLKLLDDEQLTANQNSWEDFKAAIKTDYEENLTHFQPNLKQSKNNISFSLWKITGIAAAIVIALGSLFFFVYSDTAQNALTENQTDLSSTDDRVNNFHINITQKLKLIKLNDGSEVTLYPNSSVSYSTEFGETQRDLQLTGKAKFDVKKNEELAFRVKTADFITTALGTVFIVDSRIDKKSSVNLIEGKVSIVSADSENPAFNPVVLSRGQTFNLEQNLNHGLAESIRGKEAESQEATTPKIEENRAYLFYYSNTLEMIFDDLSKRYNVKIIYNQEEIYNYTFSGKFKKDATLESILTTICGLNELSYSIQPDGSVTIKLYQLIN